MKRFCIAQAQMPVITNKSKLSEYINKTAYNAASKGASILCLPEMFCCPYDIKYFAEYSEEEGGPIWQICSSAARSNGIYFSAGTMPELTQDGRLFNTAYIFDQKGKQIAKYRKMHLFDINVQGGQKFRESDVLSAGSSVTVVDTDLCRIGIAICYDVRFTELFRLMTLSGAELILVPASFNMTTGPLHWELLFRAQAVENQIFIAGTSSSRMEDASYISWGHSIVTDPWGKVISQLGAEESLKITEIDLEQCSQVRKQIPVLKHRRTDIYRLEYQNPDN